MFFTTSGSTLEIGLTRPDWMAHEVSAADFTNDVWVPVAGVTSLGRISGEWGTDDFSIPNSLNPDDAPFVTSKKTTRPAMAMQIIAGVVAADPGQSGMVAAESSTDAFAFRLTLPNGQMRSFVALVIAADHVFDEANAVVCWSFTLKLQSNVYRGA